MGGHFFAIGLIHLISGLLGSLAIGGLTLVGCLGAAGADSAGEGVAFGGVWSILMLLIFVFACLPSLLAGWWVLQRKPMGRILAIVLAIFSLPGFPLGTAFGVWCLWALLSEEGARAYARGLPS